MMTTLLDDYFLTSVKKTIDEFHCNMNDVYKSAYITSNLPYMAPNEPAISSCAQPSQNNQRYKVGDRVRVISKEWYDMHKDYDSGDIIFKNDTFKFVKHMSCFCGMQAYITNVISKNEHCYYNIDIDDGTFSWTDNMLKDVDIEKYTVGDIMNMLDSLSNRLTNIENNLASIIRKLDPNEKENTI